MRFTFGFAVLTLCFVLNLSLAFDERDVENVQAYNFHLLPVLERKQIFQWIKSLQLLTTAS